MEIIEDPENKRYSIKPIEYNDIYNSLLKARETYWVPQELQEKYVTDIKNVHKLPKNVKEHMKNVITFFAISDGLVNEVIGEDINNRITIKEFEMWYNFQVMMEDIHGEVYSNLSEIFFETYTEQNELIKNLRNCDFIKKKIAWIKKHTKSKDGQVPLGKLILINIIMEGIFFSGSFGSIYLISELFPGDFPALDVSNEYIQRDEGMHVDFGILVYKKYIQHKLSDDNVYELFKEAVDIEIDFINMSLVGKYKSMSPDVLIDYIKFTCDERLNDLGLSKIYNVKNPIMNSIKQSSGVRVKDFFTDTTVTDYGKEVDTTISSNCFSDDW